MKFILGGDSRCTIYYGPNRGFFIDLMLIIKFSVCLIPIVQAVYNEPVLFLTSCKELFFAVNYWHNGSGGNKFMFE